MEVKQIRKLYDVMVANGYESLELELNNSGKLKLRTAADQIYHPVQNNIEEISREDNLSATQIEIRSDKIGTFYAGARKLNVGDNIKKGEVLGSVKGISFEDKIKCSVDGKIAKIAIEPGDIVDYGRLLFVVEID
ncbi:MAG: hypothetical protein Kow0029_29130 [Candidatus Rifleibacteriota bacterium]